MTTEDPNEKGSWVKIVFGPLTWHSAVHSQFSPDPPQPSIEGLVRFLTDPSLRVDLDRCVEAYHIISEYEDWTPVDFAPDDAQFLNKLVWPLRHAKSSFMLGNHLGTIALCGMISEMVAILRYEMEEFEPNSKATMPLSKFEKLGQEARVKELRRAGLIDPMIEQWFDMVRETRRRHLHYFTKDQPDASGDALICYRIACGLVSWTIGQRHYHDSPTMNPILMDWLWRKNLVHPGRPPAEYAPLEEPRFNEPDPKE